MIAVAPLSRCSARHYPSTAARWQERFLTMLPCIYRIARFALRRAPSADRQEALQEVVANAFVAYGRLVARGKEDLAYPTPLAKYALAQYRAGRRVGQPVNTRDLTSPCRQSRRELTSLTRRLAGRWEEVAVEDRSCSPAEIAIFRLDFRSWLRQLKPIRRATARLLAAGTSTSEAAAHLRLSPARVSQLRRELQSNWQRFQGEATTAAV